MILSPKDQFLKDTDACAKFVDIAASPLVHRAMTHALAAMALDGKSAEEMAGAKAFASRFLTMADKEEPLPGKLPAKTLKTY